MLKINHKNKEIKYKIIEYGKLNAGDIFLTMDKPTSRIDNNQEYLKTLDGRVKLKSGSYEHFPDTYIKDYEKVYLLNSELNLEKIIITD